MNDHAPHERDPALDALIGVTRTRRTLVTARDILRFAQAVGARDPIHFDEAAARASRHGGIVAPPLFCQSLTYEDRWPEELLPDGSPAELDLPIPAKRAVGGGSEYRVERLVRAGEEITVRSSLTDVTVKQGKSGPLYLITIDTDFTDAAGAPVAHERATYIKRI